MLKKHGKVRRVIDRLLTNVAAGRSRHSSGEAGSRSSGELRVWLSGAWLLSTLAIAAVIVGLSSSANASAPAQTGEPSATPTATTAPEQILNPFPLTEAMTETVERIVEDYEEVQAGFGDVGPLNAAQFLSQVYLPTLRGGRSPSAVTPTPTRTPIPGPRADVAITLWPSPSIHAARGGELAYEIRLKNYGAAAASSTRVTLPYNAQQLTVLRSAFTKAGDWVSELTGDRVVVTFGPAAPNEYRTATITFRVNGALADNSLITMRAPYSWTDAGGGREWRSNWAPILVRGAAANAQWVWLSVDPVAGFPGTSHRFFTDRFIPGEGIHTWLNTPAGVRGLDLRPVADGDGRVTVDFRSTGLARGTYSMVLFGARSNLTAIATFTVY
jgi:hypothetical protein